MAFHVRVVAPRDLAERIVGVLAAEPGVSNLVVLWGAGRRPEGDAVQCDLGASSANQVLRQLRTLRDERAGPLVIEVADAVIGEPPGPAAKFGIVQRDIEPAWDVVDARIRAGAVYAPSFYVLLAIAALIGAVGILINSDILIVGAMVVGPEYNAIIGVALGIEKGEAEPVIRGISALIAGFLAAIILTLAFGAVIRGSGQTPDAFARGVRPVADLISSPDLFSVVVAVLAGIVGVVSLTEARAATLIGVFISVTTIPAAASIGLSIAYTDGSRALGSVYQLLLNVVVLIAMGALGMRVQRAFWRAGARDGVARLHLTLTRGPITSPRDARPTYISPTARSSVWSTSFGSTLSSSAVSFSALVTDRCTASLTLLSPTTISPAWPGSMKSPSSLARDRDIPLDRWPLTPPMTPPAAAAPRIDGGKMSPTAAPAAMPHQAPWRVAVSSLFSWILPRASLVTTAAS
jgi:uncharacterized hydrophobic protein (TIGR00271 family)